VIQDVKIETVLTPTSFHTLLLCPEIVAVAITATKFELCALSCGWIIAPPGEQGPTVAPHGWKTTHVLCYTQSKNRTIQIVSSLLTCWLILLHISHFYVLFFTKYVK
jgi:hypothetical protein